MPFTSVAAIMTPSQASPTKSCQKVMVESKRELKFACRMSSSRSSISVKVDMLRLSVDPVPIRRSVLMSRVESVAQIIITLMSSPKIPRNLGMTRRRP